jgi:uncharacterized protein
MPAAVHSVVVKVAERCNLNCSYCYIYNHEDRSYLLRPRFMTFEVFRALLDRLKEHCQAHAPHQVSLTFHGGEPMLAGADRIRQMAAEARHVLGDDLAGLAMQTNGTLVDAGWVEVLQSSGINVGVSLDGPERVHDATRVDHLHRGSYRDAIAGLRQLQAAGLSPGVLCVINPRERGLEIYEHFLSLGLTWMSFLIPDVTHDSKQKFYGGLGATPVADYLIPAFDAWWAADDPAIQVRLFEESVRIVLGARSMTDAFGGQLSYVVVETDGEIQPVDTLRICHDGLITTGLSVLRNRFDDIADRAPLLHQMLTDGLPICATCQRCPEAEVCRGGYVSHRYSAARGFDNPSAWCPDLMKYLAHVRSQVLRVCPTINLRLSSSQTATATAC